MKMNFSNKQVIDFLSKNYKIKQGRKGEILIYLAGGVIIGILIGSLKQYYLQNKMTEEIADNIKRGQYRMNQLNAQNETLQKENENLRKKSLTAEPPSEPPKTEDTNG